METCLRKSAHKRYAEFRGRRVEIGIYEFDMRRNSYRRKDATRDAVVKGLGNLPIVTFRDQSGIDGFDAHPNGMIQNPVRQAVHESL